MSTSSDDRVRTGSPVGELEAYIAAHPGNAAAHFRLGQVCQQQQDRQRALKHLAEAVRLSPDDLNFRKMLADFQYVEMGDLESALTHYVAILDRDPRNVENLTILGNIALSMKRFGEARTFYTTIARLEPWNTEVQMILEAIARKQDAGPPVPTYQAARELAESGRPDDAIHALEQIVDADPQHVLAHNDLGVLYGARGDVQRAYEHAQAAVRSDPDNIVARKNLGDLLQSVLARPEDAMQQYLEVLRRAPAEIETLLAIGSLCLSIGRRDEARSFFEMILRHRPGHMQAQELIARMDAASAPAAGAPAVPAGDIAGLFGDPKIERILKEKQQYAREYLNDVLRQEPGNRSARRGLEGLEDVRTATAGAAEEPAGQYAEATRLAAAGQLEDARRLLQDILLRDPDCAAAHNDIAVLAGRDGDSAAAQRHYEKAIALAPDNLTFRKNLADFHFAVTGDAGAALAEYVRVLEREPKDVETLLCVGQVCEQLRRADDAVVFYGTVLKLDPSQGLAREALRRLGVAAEHHQGVYVRPE